MTSCLANTEIERHPWQGIVIAVAGLVGFLFPHIVPTRRLDEERGNPQCRLAWVRMTGMVLLLAGAGIIWLELTK